MPRVPNPNLQLEPATRPTRIALLGQISLGVILLAAFISGVLIWRGKHLQMAEGETPAWLHGAVVLHGSLNPVLCVIFGWLLCHHIRVGWQLRANLLSGFVMEAAFALLIASGAGLYYAGSEEWRSLFALLHRICGVALPLALAWHWLAGLTWARKAVAASSAPAGTAKER